MVRRAAHAARAGLMWNKDGGGGQGPLPGLASGCQRNWIGVEVSWRFGGENLQISGPGLDMSGSGVESQVMSNTHRHIAALGLIGGACLLTVLTHLVFGEAVVIVIL